MSVKLASALPAASALVALESLTNSTLPRRATCSMRWDEAGEALEALGDGGEAEPLRARERVGDGRVLPIMRASERADAGEIDPRQLAAPLHLMQHAVDGVDPRLDGLANGDALHGEGAVRGCRRWRATARRRRRSRRCRQGQDAQRSRT